jgi:osmotically-inducible protein OsmY
MRALSKLLLLAILAVVCQPLLAQTSDDELNDRVRQRLAADRDAKGGGIQVDVKNGVVTLRGKVHEEKQKKRAEKVTRKTKGVKDVVNHLEVEMASTPPPTS